MATNITIREYRVEDFVSIGQEHGCVSLAMFLGQRELRQMLLSPEQAYQVATELTKRAEALGYVPPKNETENQRK